MTDDRRNAARVNVTIRPWRVDLMGAWAPLPGWSVEIIDLSTDGARMRVIGDVAVDDQFSLDFQYRNRRFRIPARVVWVHAEEDEPGECEVGAYFEPANALTRARLDSVLGQQVSLNRRVAEPDAGVPAS